MATKANYSEELVNAIVSDYTSGKSLDEIAVTSGKSVRSLRAKLSQLGVYETTNKSPTKSVGYTREKIVRDIENKLNIAENSLASLETAKKGELVALLHALK